MTTPSGDEPDSLSGDPQAPAEAPFDPYRFGRPDHPIPPEYAPPGYVPDPTPPPAGGQPYQQPQAPYPYPYGQQGPHQQQGPYQPYGQPGPYGPAPVPPQQHEYGRPRTGNGKAIASMVLGIASMLLFWLLFLDGIVIIAAVVLGIVTLTERGRGGEGKGMAITGLVCAAIGTVAVVIASVWFVHVAAHCGGIQNANQSGFEQCIRDHVN